MVIQVLEKGLRVSVMTQPSHRVVLRFGPDVHARARRKVLEDMFGKNVRIIHGDEIGSPAHVLGLVEESGARVLDWNPSLSRWETANPLLDALEAKDVRVVYPIYLGDELAGYKKWERGRRV